MGEDGGVLKITAVNVNGIRAAYRKGMADWITANAPDVILISEVRAPDEIVTDLLGPEWNIVHQACEIKGRAGVAIASRLPVRAARVGLGTEPEVPVDTGRWVEADLELPSGGLITVVSAYIHSGTAGTPKMDQKYAHLDRVNTRMAELGASETPAMVGGDINIAHKEVDIKNWKGNLKSAGFLPEERAYLDRWFDEFGFADLGRQFGGEGPGPYTWWSNRGQAFTNDAGWRIDYQIANAALAPAARSVEVGRAASYDERWSDHAPLTAVYDLD